MILNLFGKWFRHTRTRSGTELIRFGEDAIDVEQIFAGLLATGGTGSGKSSSLDHVAVALMRLGFGGIVVAAKSGEYQRWSGLARAAGREADLVRVLPDGPVGIDVLGSELNRPGGSVESTARLIDKLMGVADTDQGNNRNTDPFFKGGSEMAGRRTLKTVHLATGEATFHDLQRCLTSAAKTPAEFASAEWVKSSYCGQLLARIDGRPRTPAEDRAYARLVEFWAGWSALADKTRSGMEVGCLNVWGRLADEPFGDLLDGTWPHRLVPEDVTERAKVVVLDIPVLTWGLPARLAQFAVVALVQEACLRRPAGVGNPVFVWRDEAGHFLHANHDMQVLTTARSHRLAHIDLVQDRDVLLAALGGGEKARVEADAFCAQHMTQLFFANANPGTNEETSRILGQRRQVLFSGGSERAGEAGLFDALLGADRTPTVSWSEQYLPEVQPGFFATGLRTGGVRNGLLVDAVLFQGGRRFAGGKPYRTVTFRQGTFDAT